MISVLKTEEKKLDLTSDQIMDRGWRHRYKIQWYVW